MKTSTIIKLLPLLVAPLFFGSCAPTTEYHTVKVYEYTPKMPTPKTVSDNPRDFNPVGLGTGR
jgi:hypothetical protein